MINIKGLHRSKRACEVCKKRKTKCSGPPAPCKWCAEHRSVCLFTESRREVSPQWVTVKNSTMEELKQKAHMYDKIMISDMDHRRSFPIEYSSERYHIPIDKEKSHEAVFNGDSLESEIPLSDLPKINPLIDQTTNTNSVCMKFTTKIIQLATVSQGNVADTIVEPPHLFYDDADLYRSKTLNDGDTIILPSIGYAKYVMRFAFDFVGQDYLVMTRNYEVEGIKEIYKLVSNSSTNSVVVTRDNRIDLSLFFALLAVGEAYDPCISEEMQTLPCAGLLLYKRSLSLLFDVFEMPTVSYIQTLLLISFYSLMLNRTRSAYLYCNMAIKASVILGLHKNLPNLNDESQESIDVKKRVWIVTYIYDKFCTTRMGFPISINDEDIDCEFPTSTTSDNIFLTRHLLAQCKLAQINSEIMNTVYRSRNHSFIQSIHKTLTQIRLWFNNLDSSLKMDYQTLELNSDTIRSTFSLHLHANYCIILVTRPLLLYKFKFFVENGYQMDNPLANAITDTCFQAAENSCRMLRYLWEKKSISYHGFFDAHYFFSSTSVLMVSAALMDYPISPILAEEIDCEIQILRQLKRTSIPALQYYQQLQNLKHYLSDEQITNFSLPNQDNGHSQPSTTRAPEYGGDLTTHDTTSHFNIPQIFESDETLKQFLDENFRNQVESERELFPEDLVDFLSLEYQR